MEMRVPFQNHSATSIEAARAILGKVYRKEQQILALFEYAKKYPPGWTDDELIAHFGTHSVRPRRIFLVACGKLRDSGTTRKTRSGRNAVVWVLV